MKRNTFSEKSDNYARARPQYPEKLYEWIAGLCVHHRCVWDCACGSGQAAIALSQYFNTVQATDISEEQIAHSKSYDNIQYSIRKAESSGFADSSFDLITVAQALHWFDYETFWPEISRVARPGSLFIAWGYSWLTCTPEVDRMLIAPFRSIIEPFWAENNRILWDGYRTEDISFPFKPLETPNFEIEVKWTVEQLIAYMMTWSAYKLSRHDRGAIKELDHAIAQTLAQVSREEELSICMPLCILAGHIKD